MATPVIDDADIQGLMRFGHGHLTEACFYVLRVVDPSAARAWLLQAPVTTAVTSKPLPAIAAAMLAPSLPKPTIE